MKPVVLVASIIVVAACGAAPCPQIVHTRAQPDPHASPEALVAQLLHVTRWSSLSQTVELFHPSLREDARALVARRQWSSVRPYLFTAASDIDRELRLGRTSFRPFPINEQARRLGVDAVMTARYRCGNGPSRLCEAGVGRQQHRWYLFDVD
jgi:hypothetical protein